MLFLALFGARNPCLVFSCIKDDTQKCNTREECEVKIDCIVKDTLLKSSLDLDFKVMDLSENTLDDLR